MAEAIVVREFVESLEALRVETIDLPENLDDTQVEVSIECAGVNFFDILLVKGQYQVKPPFPFIPGSEVNIHTIE